MTQEVVTTTSNELARPIPLTFDREQVELLKTTICKGSTDNELKLFMQVCKLKRLDPFAKQIYAIKRWDPEAGAKVMTFQVGIDGFRAKADETGKYLGQTDPEWCGSDGRWTDVWLSQDPPLAARVYILRAGFNKPMGGLALYDEYVQLTKDGKPNERWRRAPASQLAKCAESLAFRKAFPEQLGGLYTPEEMGQADPPEDPRPAEMRPTDAQLQKQEALRPAVAGAILAHAEKQTAPAAAPTALTTPVDPEIQALVARMISREATAKVFAELKQSCITVLGAEAGEKGYYGILARHGVQHANEFKSTGPAKEAAKYIFTTLRSIQNERAQEAAALAQRTSTEPSLADEWGDPPSDPTLNG